MAITVKDKIFNLETKNTLYQMKVDRFGVLNHLWYGEKTDCCMDYLLDYPDAGFSGNIYEAENERTYSLNTLPQEYSTSGVGDFRISAISVTHEDGSNALDLRVREYQIKKGKYEIPGLPAVYAKEDEAETLEITLKDTATEAEVILKYGVFEKEDVITRSVVVKNSGKTPIVINKVHSMCLDIPYGDWEWMHFYGRHTMERQAERVPVLHGISESSSSRGTSSHHQNPAVLLCEKDCTETNGHCIGAALMYSGGFQAQVEKDQLEQVRLVMGIHPDTFEWTLEAGEAFYTPEVILSCSTTGFAKLSQNFHHIIRNHVCRGTYQLSSRPVLINNWEATYFDFNEEKILNIARQASKLGIDMMVLDDGWFGKRDDDCSGLGDWFVNEKKLNGGLKALVEKINAMGMKFGLWFEPEMVSEDSDLYRNHPDWAIQIPGRKPMRSRYQLVLDMSNPEVVDYLYGVMSAILRENHIEYVKWDMNRPMTDMPYEGYNHKYTLGFYKIMDAITGAFPNILFEGCSGGGGRFDAGVLAYMPQIWTSDNSDAAARLKIQYATSMGYPVSAISAHVTAVPNHQNGRITSLKMRADTAYAGVFGYELDITKMSDTELAEIKKQVETDKKLRTLMRTGDFYRILSPYETNYCSWEMVSKDKKEVFFYSAKIFSVANSHDIRIKLKGLDAEAKYMDTVTGEVYGGDELMYYGVEPKYDMHDFASYTMMLNRV